MSTETSNEKIKIDNGTTFGKTYTDKAIDEKLANISGSSLYVHNLRLIAGNNNTRLYFSALSGSNLGIDYIDGLNNLLGTTPRSISCSGVLELNGQFFNIMAIAWSNNYAQSAIIYNNEGETFLPLAYAFKSVTIEDGISQV